jgi:hypothetical protein
MNTTKTTIINTAGANLRPTPSLALSPLTVIPKGSEVEVIPLASIDSNGYTWQAIAYGDKAGWVVKSFLANSKPNETLAGYGLHILQGGSAGEVLNIAKRLAAINKPLKCVTVVNDKELANNLAPYVQYVIFRSVEGPGDPDNFKPNESGLDWARNQFTKHDLFDLDRRVYLQLANEPRWTPNDNQIWIDAMQYANLVNRRLAILSYAVGNPEPDQWIKLASALAFAKQSGHIVNLHVYSAAGTPAGSLSAPNLLPYYEGRFIKFYESVPEASRPVLVLSEAACEFTAGEFQGVDNCVSWAKALYEYIKKYDYVAGMCLWTVGQGWPKSSIDSALSKLEQLFRGSL